MKINVVLGFFNPCPPLQGGGVERMWGLLAEEFARRGHQVTVLSRCWPGLPDREFRNGVQHHRLPGFAHQPQLWKNLLLDLRWSQRVKKNLPAADLTVTNSLCFPCLARRLPRAGAIVANLNRHPRGQLRFYAGIAGVQVPSAAILAAARRQAPRRLRDQIQLIPNTADLSPLFHLPRPGKIDSPRVIGFIGRLHPEKGVHLLVEACAKLARRPDLPEWKLRLTGPIEIAQGGGGPAYGRRLERLAEPLIDSGRFEMTPPEFAAAGLVRRYADLDMFVYPSLARGETFGIAILEAMAAGLPTVVSRLECFQPLTQNHTSARSFDHTSPRAPDHLAEILAQLLSNPSQQTELTARGRAVAATYELPKIAEMHLAHFSAVLDASGRSR